MMYSYPLSSDAMPKHSSFGVYTTTHVDSLELLINECPEIGGFGVIMAAGLLRYLTNDNTWAHDTCSVPPAAREWKPNRAPVSNSNLAIAPNPGGDWFDIRNADEGTIEVADIYGRLVFTGDIAKIGTRIDTRTWHSGTYIIRLSSGEFGRGASLIWVKK
ncbi:MAG: T9SS type A sorting domain-containing protein [Saprospiraceae bacterium]|nr:T9SS type A sorting domain-containing protein [Saprospiraceae bacterium]